MLASRHTGGTLPAKKRQRRAELAVNRAFLCIKLHFLHIPAFFIAVPDVLEAAAWILVN